MWSRNLLGLDVLVQIDRYSRHPPLTLFVVDARVVVSLSSQLVMIGVLANAECSTWSMSMVAMVP